MAGGAQGAAAEPVTKKRGKHDQEGQETLFRQAKAIQGLIEGLRGHGRINQKNAAADNHALAGDAVLQSLQIRGDERHACGRRFRQRGLCRLESRRAKNPLAVGAGNFKNGTVCPQAGEFAQFLLHFRKSPGR